MSGFAELGAEFADRFLVAGLLVGEPLGAVGFSVSIAVRVAVSSDRSPASSARCPGGLGLLVSELFPGCGQLA